MKVFEVFEEPNAPTPNSFNALLYRREILDKRYHNMYQTSKHNQIKLHQIAVQLRKTKNQIEDFPYKILSIPVANFLINIKAFCDKNTLDTVFISNIAYRNNLEIVQFDVVYEKNKPTATLISYSMLIKNIYTFMYNTRYSSVNQSLVDHFLEWCNLRGNVDPSD